MNIFNFFSKLRAMKKQDENDPTYRRAFAEKLNNKIIRYVTEREENPETGEVVDTIIGKNGVLFINSEGHFVVICNNEDIFRANTPDLKASELLSLEGVILESFDLVQNKERKIIAYYKYYR